MADATTVTCGTGSSRRLIELSVTSASRGGWLGGAGPSVKTPTTAAVEGGDVAKGRE